MIGRYYKRYLMLIPNCIIIFFVLVPLRFFVSTLQKFYWPYIWFPFSFICVHCVEMAQLTIMVIAMKHTCNFFQITL